MSDGFLNRYRFALCDERIKSISDVTKENRKESKFFCLGCGHEMVAVLGEKREHHFRHKNNENCSNETYLHNYAKRRLKEIFDSRDNYFIQYNATNSCEQFGSCPFSCNKDLKHRIDLKEFFDTCELEKNCGNFRPDILLSHSEHPERKLFIEINVKHPCSDEKLESGFRIIEIDVENEFSKIYPFDEDNRNIHFYNFKFNREILQTHKVKRFSLLSENNEYIEDDIRDIDCSKYNKHSENAVFDITLLNNYKQYNLRLLGLAYCMKKNLIVRNCEFCVANHQCSIVLPEERNGKRYMARKMVKDIHWCYLFDVAKKCEKFDAKISMCDKVIRRFGSNNYILWEKDQKGDNIEEG